MTADRERVALAAFVTAAVLAGGNAVSIRFSNRELAPLLGAGLRFSLAAALLGAVMVVFNLKPPRGRALTGAVLYGLLNFGAGLALAYYALVRLHAGFVQMLLALVPLVTLLLAVVQRQERLHLAAVGGTCSPSLGSPYCRGRRCGSRSRSSRCWPRWAAHCASRKRPCSCAASPRCTR